MKLLQVIPTLTVKHGGTRVVSYLISKELAKRGHEITIFTSDVDLSQELTKTLQCHQIKVRSFKATLKKVTYAQKYYITLGLMKKEVLEAIKHFNVIHLHGYRTFQNVILHYHAKKSNIPYILQAHGSIPRKGKQWLKWFYDVLFGYRLLRDASKVIALSRVEAEQYKSMGVPEEKIAIIPNGIDLSEYIELPPKGTFKKKFNIPEAKKIILYLGRIHETKGIDFLVKAYAHLKNEMHFKDAILVIAGPDDGYLGEVKHLVQELDISSSVLFTGPLYGKDKISAYVDSDVYVLPSRYETFPMTVLEAYACGTPVIASKVGGLMDLVIEGVTGLLFESGDVMELAKSIFLLLDNQEKAEDMGLKGRQLVKEKFSIESVVDKLERVYKEVISGW